MDLDVADFFIVSIYETWTSSSDEQRSAIVTCFSFFHERGLVGVDNLATKSMLKR